MERALIEQAAAEAVSLLAAAVRHQAALAVERQEPELVELLLAVAERIEEEGGARA